MDMCMLSIDWDYFVYSQKYYWSFFSENMKSIIDLWYKRYIQAKAHGEDIQKAFYLSAELNTFWDKIKKHFVFIKGIKFFVSDSHTLSYNIAKDNGCKSVYLFDSHSDLGYSGLSSLEQGVNCSNWLGRLLKDKYIKEADIIYSPYTKERPEYFKPINSLYNIKYLNFKDLDQRIVVSAIHVCRSGTWTPPWLDNEFKKFIESLGLQYKVVSCPERKWDTANISISDHINYLLA